MTTDLEKLRIDKSHKAAPDSRPIWPWILLLLLAAAVSFAAWQWTKTSNALPVQTLRVKLPEGANAASDLVTLNATGYIIAAHKIELASKVVGRVAWVGVEMGDKVKKDDVLVRLEDDEYKARVTMQTGLLESANAKFKELQTGNRPYEIAAALDQYDRARVEADNAKRNYDRVLGVKSNLKAAEIDDAEANMLSKKAAADYARQQYEMMKEGTREEQIAAQKAVVKQLEGSLALATLDLNNTVIRAPLDATILERNVELGEFVTNGFVGDRGAKGYVLSIADLNDLLVELDISQNDFAKVSANQPCWITTDAYPDRKYAGTVERISPVANRQKATILVRVRVTNPDELLKPDMNATVSFLSAKKTVPTQSVEGSAPSFRIPVSAIRNNSVFVVEDSKAIQRPITTGLTAANGQIEVKKGLIGGEDLILNPPESLMPGAAVKIQN